MTVKIRKRLHLNYLIERSREDFKHNLKSVIAPEILKTIEGGNNPVKAGKQPQYSKSYIDQIEGKVRFINKGGKVIPLRPSENSQGAMSSLKDNGKGGYSRTKKVSFQKGMGFGKLKSPVNAKLTGALHASIVTTFTLKGLLVTFTDKKAEWLNNIGVGKDKKKYRLLPNNPGEEFNANIFKRIMDSLRDAVKKNL